MPSTAPRAARAGSAAQDAPAGPVTLVVGEEELLAERAVARLVAAAGPADSVRHVRAAELRPGELATLTAPSLFGDGCVLVLHGTEDPIVDVAVARYAAETIPGARVSLWAGAKHALFVEDPARFVAELTSFLDEL